MEVDNVACSIASGQSLSGQIDFGSKSLVALILPSNWSASAGGLTFQASVDGGQTWSELTTTAGTAFTIAYTVAGAAYLAVDATTLRGVQSIKIRSGTVGVPVNQANTVALQLITRVVRGR
jgi:hypothetical protein